MATKPASSNQRRTRRRVRGFRLRSVAFADIMRFSLTEDARAALSYAAQEQIRWSTFRSSSSTASDFLSALQSERYLVGRDGSFPKNFPRTIGGEVNDGGSNATAGGPSIHNQRNAVTYLIAHTGGVIALGQSLQVGGRGGDGQSQRLHDGPGNHRAGHAQRHVTGVRRRTE